MIRFWLCFGFALSLAAAAAPAGALPPPERAAPAVLDWNTEFPVTPPFTNWSRVQAHDLQTNKPADIFLHGASLHWKQIPGAGRWLAADVIIYNDGASGGAAGYQRFLFNLSCNSNQILAVVAAAPVVVSPDGAITPVSAVHAGDYWDVIRRPSGTLYHDLCFNSSFQQRFMR